MLDGFAQASLSGQVYIVAHNDGRREENSLVSSSED